MKKLRSLTVNILTIFPELLEPAFACSILKRAKEKGIFKPRLINVRDYTRDKHRTVDDKSYGGGCGMVMKIEPIAKALAALKRSGGTGKIYCLSPTGRVFYQAFAQTLSRAKRFTLICGRYEGLDQRIVDKLCDGEISIGDYVLSGGEPAAVVIADAVVRLLPGVLGDQDSAQQDSFSDGLLDTPHYTRPSQYRQWKVPEVLLTGNHAQVARWRREQQMVRTLGLRPDLLEQAVLNPLEKEFIEHWKSNQPKFWRIRRRKGNE